jgi:hypothetical protein
MPGICRRPFFACAPSIMRDIRIIVWKAVQHWGITGRRTKFGESYFLKTRAQSCWTPNSVVWLYKTIDANILARKQNANSSPSVVHTCSDVSFASSGPSPLVSPVTNKNAHKPQLTSNASAAEIKCFYGHKVSSSTDGQGREQWRFSPTPPWPCVPPARPLCQKCYLFHRAAALRGQSKYHFTQLYAIRPPDTGGASSSSTARPPGIGFS